MVSYIPIWFIKVWTEKRRTRRAMATSWGINDHLLIHSFYHSYWLLQCHSYLTLPQCYDHSYLTLPRWLWPQLPVSTTVPMTTATWLYHSAITTATRLFHSEYDRSYLTLPQWIWPQLPDSTTVSSPQLPDSSTVNMTTATWLFHSEYDHCYLTLPECPLPQLPYSSTVPITTATWLCQCRRISEACWAVQSLWGRCVRSWSHEIINIIEKLTKLTKNYKIKTKQKNQNINSR